MSDPGTEHQGASCMSLVLAYVRTRKGIILAAEIAFCIVILICYAASRYPGYLGLAITELIFCLIIFFIYALKYDQQFAVIHWGWTDFIRAAIGSGLLIILSLVCLIRGSDGPGIAGSVFGLLAGILFGYDAFITFPPLRKTHTQAATESPDNI
ncbi:proteolipid protein 2 [Pseudophryne corroboree]|uniref:proteolipid protein 2 n=1 Tax=Pseudophryne corroboree TaxID=495146 RepID=UPI0030814E2D